MYVIKILLFGNGGEGRYGKEIEGDKGQKGMGFCLELQRGQEI